MLPAKTFFISSQNMNTWERLDLEISVAHAMMHCSTLHFETYMNMDAFPDTR